MVGERVSLARECVLTAFSIKPELSTLNRIREFARISGIDQEQVGANRDWMHYPDIILSPEVFILKIYMNIYK